VEIGPNEVCDNYLFLIINSQLDHLILLSIKVPFSVYAFEEGNGLKRPTPNKE